MKDIDKASEKQTVLVVDDAPANIQVVNSILKDTYKVRIATNGAKALELVRTSPRPDLILLDVMMPDIDGFEACRRLKANPKLVDVPVIFITSKNEDEYEETGFSVGASDFIHKPINAPILMARVKTHIKIKFVMDYLRNENTRLQGTAKQSSSELVEVIKMLWGSPFVKF